MQTDLWDSAIADGTVAHLPAAQAEVFQSLYAKIKAYQVRSELEEITWARLHAIRRPGHISDALSADMIAQADEARQRMMDNDAVAKRGLEMIRALGIKPSYEIVLDGPGTRRDVIDGFRDIRLCDSARVTGEPQP